ncbi:Oidioi.mRNA.OKI2018_I69.chr2.g6329.t1.cds [Oikopleura dioica]|uniref:Oidioi.mRNA.OKI2018_I69.chr2.g6329.t1.cds n=1 Tax=Oikopleura dioica TaxID=34765 RepID=A0ABN7TC01_OIKDI|nr:Oidioi.mRNA.OKI2018_I69.chr2.g6329.t1.cds [Oikopleura dioica]
MKILKKMLDPYEEHFFVSLSNVWEAYVKGIIPDNCYLDSCLSERSNPVDFLRKEMSSLVIDRSLSMKKKITEAMNVNHRLGKLMIYKNFLSLHKTCLKYLIDYIPGFQDMAESTKNTIVSKSWFAVKVLRGVSVTNTTDYSHIELTGEDITVDFYNEIGVPTSLLNDIKLIIFSIFTQGSNMREFPLIMAIIFLSVDLEDENVAFSDRPVLQRLLKMASTVLLKMIKQVNYTVDFQRHVARVFQHMQITKQKLRTDRDEIHNYSVYEPKIMSLSEIPSPCP